MISIPFSAEWTEFKSQGCSATCGEGTETFTRECVGAGECEGDAFLTQPCKDLPVCGKFEIYHRTVQTFVSI